MKWPWLQLYAILLATCTLLLLITGTFVTGNEERPLFSVGRVHPMAGVFVSILMIGLVLLLSFVETRSWMRWLSRASLGAMAVESLLGLIESPRRLMVSFFHTLLAYSLFAATIAIVVFTSRSWKRTMETVEADHRKPSLRSLVIIAWVAVVAQIVIGTAFRYGGADVIIHILGAMIVVVLILVVGVRAKEQFREHRALRFSATAMMGITLLQVLLGAAVLSIQAINPEDPLPVILGISIHAATAALTLAAIVVLTIQIHRYTIVSTDGDAVGSTEQIGLRARQRG